jgi:hypothetical protein
MISLVLRRELPNRMTIYERVDAIELYNRVLILPPVARREEHTTTLLPSAGETVPGDAVMTGQTS